MYAVFSLTQLRLMNTYLRSFIAIPLNVRKRRLLKCRISSWSLLCFSILYYLLVVLAWCPRLHSIGTMLIQLGL